jgi:uncharacterized protein
LEIVDLFDGFGINRAKSGAKAPGGCGVAPTGLPVGLAASRSRLGRNGLARLRVVYGRDILKLVAERKDPLQACTGFEWDEANAQKNWERHRVTPEEAEDVFFNEPLVVRSDAHRSKQEKRYYALGQTGVGRRLFVAFTIRGNLLRVISVRDMNQRETEAYANLQKKTSA